MLDILLVDDEPLIRLTIGDALEQAGYALTRAADGGEAAELLEQRRFDLLISDVRLPKMDGLRLLQRVREQGLGTDVILITAYGDVADAVAALKAGARDYLTKPFEIDELLARVARINEERRLRDALGEARAALARRRQQEGFVAISPAMLKVFDRIEAFAQHDASVLILGESGTGKELVARALHERSPRHDKPFVAVNCAAFPETLIDAELFGHERGAFTGATRKREGRFEAAQGGTLFLDEVAEVPLPVQAKLLRVLQERRVEPLGANRSVAVNVRILSATHRNLRQRIAEGLFREDLFYRLNVLEIVIPPLRERRGDLPILVQQLLRRVVAEGDLPSISPRAMMALNVYPFPGNVRELEHALHQAVVLSRGGEIDLDHLPLTIAGMSLDPELVLHAATVPAGPMLPLPAATKAFERAYLLRALRETSGRKNDAATLLGISRKALWEKSRAHGIHDTEINQEPVPDQ